MTTPTGFIQASDVNVELGRPWNQWFDMNEWAVRQLAGKPSGVISFHDLRGKSWMIREPASGEAYNLASPFTTWQQTGGGWAKIYWYNDSPVYDGRPGADATVIVAGTWTYYRGTQRYFSGSTSYNGVWRVGRY